jgi:hypothetical protein
MRLLPEFDSGVKVDEIPTSDFLEIIAELTVIAESMIELPHGSAVWRALLGGTLTLTVGAWEVHYLVDMAQDRLRVASVSRV